MDYIKLILGSTLTLLALLNPFGNVPLFIAMTEGKCKNLRKKIFNTVTLTAFSIVIFFAVIGKFMMDDFFKVSMGELRMAGGILLLVVALKNLLFPPASRVSESTRKNDEEIDVEAEVKKAIIPMAFPMLVGPGSLAAVLIIRQSKGLDVAIGSAIIAFSIIFLLFKSANVIERVLGNLPLFVLSRVMQIFIMAVGIKTFILGLQDVLANL